MLRPLLPVGIMTGYTGYVSIRIQGQVSGCLRRPHTNRVFVGPFQAVTMACSTKPVKV